MDRPNEYSKSYQETMIKWYKHSIPFGVYLTISILFFKGCGSSVFMFPSSSDQLYTLSNMPLSEIYDQLEIQSPPRSFFGKGKLLFSAPGQSERLSFDYYVSQNREVYELKNRIGIPVATIQIDVDSVLFLDRIESQVIRWHKNAIPLSASALIPPIRLYELIHYEHWILQTQQVHQSTKDIRLTIPDIGYIFLELETFALSKIYHNKSSRESIGEVWKLQVNGRKNYKNSPIARTFSIENETRKTQLFIQLVELQFNQSIIPPRVTIPNNYTQNQ